MLRTVESHQTDSGGIVKYIYGRLKMPVDTAWIRDQSDTLADKSLKFPVTQNLYTRFYDRTGRIDFQ